MRGSELNTQPSDYEPDVLPLNYPAFVVIRIAGYYHPALVSGMCNVTTVADHANRFSLLLTTNSEVVQSNRRITLIHPTIVCKHAISIEVLIRMLSQMFPHITPSSFIRGEHFLVEFTIFTIDNKRHLQFLLCC